MKQNRVFLYISGVLADTFSDSAYARRHAGRNAAVQILVATAAFILLVRIFPMGLVQNHTISAPKAHPAAERGGLPGDVFTSGDKKLQTVSFAGGHLCRIRLYMGCAVDRDAKGAQRIRFRLYNDAFSCIYEEDVDSRGIEKDGFLTAVPDMDVEPGKPYYYEILIPEESHAVYVLPTADRGALAQPENGILYIDGIIHDEVSLVADFDYTEPLTAAEVAAYDILILAAAGFLYLGLLILVRMYDEHLWQYSESAGRCLRAGAGVLAVAAAAALFVYAVVCNRFGGEIWDRLVFAAGIAVSAAWAAGFLHFGGKAARLRKHPGMPAADKIGLVWRNYLQTVSFGLLFYALCQYVNADRMFLQYTNTRWMLIFLAIALLMNYHEKQFLNRISLLWLLAGTAGSAFYCRAAGTDENTLLLARLTCGVVVAWGLVIVNIAIHNICYGNIRRNFGITRIRRAVAKNKQQSVYIGLWIVFCVFLYVYRYEKVWVFTATLPFTALFFTRNTPAFQSRFLRNFCNGILLSFALVVLFCLAHRPHHYWMLYRYGGIFHTVACTGMYLAVVFGAAAAKLYGKLKNRRQMFARCYAEYFVTACAAGFILLTMSRTAFLTTAVTACAIVLLTAAAYRKGIRRILSELGILAAACLFSFPMVYTAVRTVPAVINDPVRYDIEFQDESFMICRGDPVDSDKYMTVRRFFSTFFGRFQTQGEEDGQAREEALLVYAADGFAGLDMRTAYGQSDEASGEEDADGRQDISNGRFEIFRDYLRATGLGGHPGMGPVNENGGEYAHAHNSYLQAAYNFGMIAGVIFLILCALTLWKTVRLFVRHGSRYGILLVPFALVVAFGFVSLTEWAFHPCIPAGFSFILIQAMMMRDMTDWR